MFNLLETAIWMDNPGVLIKLSLLLQVHCMLGSKELEAQFVVVRRNHREEVLLDAAATAAELRGGFGQIVGN